MSKKVNTTKEKTVLIVPEVDFKKSLEERIEEGKRLLNIEVPQESSYNNGFYPYRTGRDKVSYSEPALKEFKNSYSSWNDFNLELLKQSFEPSDNEYYNSYRQCNAILVWGAGNDPLKTYKDIIESEIKELENLNRKLPLIPHNTTVTNQVTETSIQEKPESVIGKDIFIVHGHNNELKETVARVLEKLGLNPIILHEQPNKGKTIIEKLEDAANRAGFAIILLTGDDIGRSQKEDALKPRARQNVIFEMGLFMGKIGRARVMPLLEEGVENPSDLEGIVYTPIDSKDSWKLDLVQELQAAGYKVSADKLRN